MSLGVNYPLYCQKWKNCLLNVAFHLSFLSSLYIWRTLVKLTIGVMILIWTRIVKIWEDVKHFKTNMHPFINFGWSLSYPNEGEPKLKDHFIFTQKQKYIYKSVSYNWTCYNLQEVKSRLHFVLTFAFLYLNANFQRDFTLLWITNSVSGE